MNAGRGLAWGAALCGAMVWLAVSPAHAQLAARPWMRANGLAAGDRFSQGLAPGGDLNGDGYNDLLVGSPGVNGAILGDIGAAYVLLGRGVPDSIADFSVPGITSNGHMGGALAGVGDVDRDGFDDWLVASPEYFGTTGTVAGRVLLYRGGTELDIHAFRGYSPASGAVAHFGTALSAAGDFNADGNPDFAIGAISAGGDTSSAYVIYGGPDPSRSIDLSLSTPSGTGTRALVTGDVNGDGWSDLIAGISSSVGIQRCRVWVYCGSPTPDSRADFQFDSQQDFDGFGLALATGDFNGDGFTDIAVGAPYRFAAGLSSPGQVFVYYGGPLLGTLPVLVQTGEFSDDYFGSAVASVGDLDGDGYDDLAIGAPQANSRGPDAGRVYVCFGGPSFDLVPDLVIDGEASGDLFGSTIARAGDLDGSGTAAMAIGAYRNDTGGADAGRLYVMRVSRFGIVAPDAGARWVAGGRATIAWTGTDPADLDLSLDGGTSWRPLGRGLGGAASNVLDLDVPGEPCASARVRVTRAGSSPGAGASAWSRGLFHLVNLRSPPPAVLFAPEAPGPPGDGRLGAAVAVGVDLDGDGLPDLTGGAPYLGDGAVEIRAEPGPPPAKPPLRITGLGPAEQFGASLANVGDLDGDGWNDLAVGAPNAVSDGLRKGRVYVFRGGPAADQSPYRILEGERDGESFGASVANAGDTDGDGADDLVVGAPGNGIPGLAYVFFGGQSFDEVPDVTLTAGTNSAFGSVVSAAGDVNGDGFADVLVNGPPLVSRPAGTVHLFYGAAEPSAWKRVSFEGGRVGDGFGAALCSAGDLDGDGFGDFAVGAPLADGPGPDAGAVFLYYGNPRFLPVPATVIHGASAQQYLGSALLGGLDLDADGLSDLVIGSPGDATAGADAGRLDVLFGGGDGLLDRSFFGTPGARLGSALAGRTVIADSVFAVIAAGAPLDGNGRVTGLVASRWRFTAPAPATEWIAGSRQRVSWDGATTADLVFVGEGGSVTALASSVGGAESNTLEVGFPATLPDLGTLELRATGGGPGGRAIGPVITLEHVLRVLRFEWEPSGDGVALHWATEPPLGPGGVAGFRLYRAAGGGSPVQVGGTIEDTTYFDLDGRVGDRYSLVAITELGAEFEAGAVALPEAPTQIRVWPQPAGESGQVQIEFAAPGRNGEIARDLEAKVFDARGRHIATLAFGRPLTRAGVVRLNWDGRDLRHQRAGPGLYFLRVRAPSAGFERTRRIVMLDSR